MSLLGKHFSLLVAKRSSKIAGQTVPGLCDLKSPIKPKKYEYILEKPKAIQPNDLVMSFCVEIEKNVVSSLIFI
jgi:hypothetical protein